MNEPDSIDLLETTLWNTAKTAAALNFSERTLYKLTEPRGSLKCVRFQGRTMYRPSDIKTWLDERQANQLPPRKRDTPVVRKPRRSGKKTSRTVQP